MLLSATEMNVREKKAFTLVELLVALAIISALAGLFLLNVQAAQDRATAVKIVANMRNVKAAAIMYYMDSGLRAPKETNITVFAFGGNKKDSPSEYENHDHPTFLDPYLSNEGALGPFGGSYRYCFYPYFRFNIPDRGKGAVVFLAGEDDTCLDLPPVHTTVGGEKISP